MTLEIKTVLSAPHDRATLPRPAVPGTSSAPTPQTRPPAPAPGRSVVVVEPPPLPRHVPGQGREYIESPMKKRLMGLNARALSPREMQALSEDLYAGGVLSWEEHAELAFQADLHPAFARTIGALTGERPLPDQPRDYVKVWEARLDFERRYFPEGPARDRALRILSVLRRIDAATALKA